MKILVPIKRVPDYSVRIRVKGDGSGIETDSVKWIVNPFDEIAVEEAIRLREKGHCSDITVVTVGPTDAQQQLRYTMAMGADRAIQVNFNGIIDSDLASRALVEVFKKGDYGLVIMGKQSIDSDAGQTPQLLAGRLGLPHASFASKIEIKDEKATVTREVDGGLETIAIDIPAVISTDLRLNEPRYAPLPGIMKAKSKPLEVLQLGELGVDGSNGLRILRMSPPSKKGAGRKVQSVEELITALETEAKVL